MFEELFERQKPSEKALLDFGFRKQDQDYLYSCPILNGEFELHISIAEGKDPQTSVTELANQEDYSLYKTNAQGELVSQVRKAVEDELLKIRDECYESTIFSSEQAEAIIHYVEEKYGASLEYLWKQFPDYAVCRRKDNDKWYLLLMEIPKSKLTGTGSGLVDVMDVKENPEEIDRLVDGIRYFRGWHMNKKNWLSVILDGSLSNEEVFSLIDHSYELA